MAEEVQEEQQESGVPTKEEAREAKILERQIKLAIRHLSIAKRYEENDLPLNNELVEMFKAHPIIPQKYNELAKKRNDLIHKYDETGDKKLLKEQKRLKFTIPSFDEFDKEEAKKLKRMYKYFLKSHLKMQRHQAIIDYHTQRFDQIVAGNPHLSEFMREHELNKIFEMDEEKPE